MCVGVVVLECGAIGCALDVVGGTFHGDRLRAVLAIAMVVDDIVERALAFLAQTELDGSLPYAVHAAAEP